MKHITPRGPCKPSWHRDAERRQVAEALRNDSPGRNRERFLTPTSAKREDELLGRVKPEEIKP